MSGHKSKKIVSILMESPLYLTLSTEERHALITRLAETYPLLLEEEEDDETGIGYEASWKGIIH